jgi:sorting nexin-5/6/32
VQFICLHGGIFRYRENFCIQNFIRHYITSAVYTASFNPLISDVADSYIKISTGLVQLSTIDNSDLEKFLTKVAETFEKARVSVCT